MSKFWMFLLAILSLARPGISVEQTKRPQEPKPPYPYYEEEVSYENKAAGVTLVGTLTLPRSKGPFPAVILIHGSAPLNRNEELLGHKPFLVWADHLTRQGIAVLRFDKRGAGKSTGIYDNASAVDFVDDVLAGTAFLKTRKEINPRQIGLIGHSEGGMVAPMAAAKSDDIAFIVMMAGPGVNGEEIICEQAALLQRADGVAEETISLDHKLLEQMIAIVKKETDRTAAETQLRDTIAKHCAALSEPQKKTFEENNAALERRIKMLNSVWCRFFLINEPVHALRQVKIPVLVLNGDLDLVVSSKQNLPVIAKALEESGNKDCTIMELPKLNHVFQTCQTGSYSECPLIEETISPSALNLMSEWILKRTLKK